MAATARRATAAAEVKVQKRIKPRRAQSPQGRCALSSKCFIAGDAKRSATLCISIPASRAVARRSVGLASHAVAINGAPCDACFETRSTGFLLTAFRDTVEFGRLIMGSLRAMCGASLPASVFDFLVPRRRSGPRVTATEHSVAGAVFPLLYPQSLFPNPGLTPVRSSCLYKFNGFGGLVVLLCCCASILKINCRKAQEARRPRRAEWPPAASGGSLAGTWPCEVGCPRSRVRLTGEAASSVHKAPIEKNHRGRRARQHTHTPSGPTKIRS